MRALLDSGVWVSAINTDEPHHAASRALLEAAVSARLDAYALDLTIYECTNVAVLKWGSVADAERLIDVIFQSCPERVPGVNAARGSALARAADERGLTAYDASYVSCAAELGLVLVSTDLQDLVDPGLAISPEDALGRLGLA